MQQLEKMLDEWLVKKAPFQIPEAGRKGLVEALPWLTLIGGVLMLLVAWWLYQAAAYVTTLADDLIYITGYVTPTVTTYGPLLWVSLALLVIEAILFFLAFPALRERKKSGWNLLFWLALLNVVQTVVQGIAYTSIGSLVSALLATVLGLYLLFQIRGYYTGTVEAAGANSTMKPPKETPPAAKTGKTPENPENKA